jgi:hypothetical protein
MQVTSDVRGFAATTQLGAALRDARISRSAT